MEMVPNTAMPFIMNGQLVARSNVVIVQNAGNILVTLDDAWTLRPGEKLQFGSYDNLGIIRLTFLVKFSGSSLIPGEDDNPLLEVIEVKAANIPALSDYEDQSNNG